MILPPRPHHAENGDIIDHLDERFMSDCKYTPEYFPASHPYLSEAEAIFRLLSLAKIAGCTIYIPHISTAESLDVLDLFRKWGTANFYAKTCPHYLTLLESEMTKRGSIAKMEPPLRRQEDLEALWQAASNGRLDVIASDAAGHLTEANEPLHDSI